MKHPFRKLAALSLALLLIFSALPVRAFAEEPLAKEEVVYVNLNADGSVKEVNVVNIFHLETAGTITDYGAYEALRNMTSTAPVNYVGDTVTIAAEAGKLYYEGKLSGGVIPWNIGIRYYLDGKEYSAAEVAGKSGALKIALDGCDVGDTVEVQVYRMSDKKTHTFQVTLVSQNEIEGN